MSANIVIFSRFRLCETKANSLKKTLKRARGKLKPVYNKPILFLTLRQFIQTDIGKNK